MIFYATPKEYTELKEKKFMICRLWEGIQMGQTVDVYGSTDDIGITATVAEIYPQYRTCVIERW